MLEQLLTTAIDPPPTIRLLTPKAGPNGRQPNKSKGCAFLEFAAKSALQQALKLHQSELDGRMINVELTAGGGGKSEGRIEKLCMQSITGVRLSHSYVPPAKTSREADQEAQGRGRGNRESPSAETTTVLSDLRRGASTAQETDMECSGAGRGGGEEDEEAGQANTALAGHGRERDPCRLMI